MYNAIMIDDEQPALDVLKLFLERTGQINVIGSFCSAVEAESQVQRLKPDVAFIDIDMPKMSGLELAEKIVDASCDIEIVFVTAHDQYALEAFQVNAIDYILKPLSYENVLNVIKKLKKIKPQPVSSQAPTDKGRIFCFERFLVYGVGSKTAIKWRTSKTEELFALLVQNADKIISKWRITQALWPEFEVEKCNVYLHTTIYNLKKTLISAKINFDLLFINGGYQLSLPDIYIDTKEFITIFNAALAAPAPSIMGYKPAYNLYKGRYLDENEYAWAHGKGDEYALKYHQLVCEMYQLYLSKHYYASAESLLQKALTIDPLDDCFNEMLLNLYLLKRDKAALVMQYNKTKSLYHDELGIELNTSMRSIFNQAIKL